MEESLNIKECVGCGFCCTKALCNAALRLYSTNTPPCPALVWNGTRNICNLMTLPGLLGENYRSELYAGEGCCCNLNSWRKEPLEDRTGPKKEVRLINPLPKELQFFIVALAGEFISSDKMQLILGSFRARLTKNGYATEESKAIVNYCIDIFNEQRSSRMKDFMG